MAVNWRTQISAPLTQRCEVGNGGRTRLAFPAEYCLRQVHCHPSQFAEYVFTLVPISYFRFLQGLPHSGVYVS